MHHPDRRGHEERYSGRFSDLLEMGTPCRFRRIYRERELSPFHAGGTTKGYVRGLATRSLFEAAAGTGRSFGALTVLDAGCGLGELSVYLACRGFRVVGVDVSTAGCVGARMLARHIGVDRRCRFLTASLERIPLDDRSVDFVIGHASLHHFIKYPGAAGELWRIMRPGARGYFADSFGENPAYRLFHDRAKMERLGDAVLTRRKVLDFFESFEVRLHPTDWFVMLDKLYLRITRGRFGGALRRLSRLHHHLDRKIPANWRPSLFLAGSVMTRIRKA